MSLSIEMLPAREGDALWVTWGEHSMLIDGGRAATAPALKDKLDALEQPLELLVTSHVDRDHIEGLLKLTEGAGFQMQCREIWYNCFDHLEGKRVYVPANYETAPEYEHLGARQGEEWADRILAGNWRWNRRFDGKAVEVGEDNIHVLNGGARIVLLSPDREKLEDLISKWKRECRKAGMSPGTETPDPPEGWERLGFNIDNAAEEPFEDDHSPANGSSIAFLLEVDERCVLLAGDAHVDRLIAGLDDYMGDSAERLKLDAFKLPHHGSSHNVSKELLQRIDCDHYLVSTNGSYFDHPTGVAIARIVKYGGDNVNLHFNYRSPETEVWDNRHWKRRFGYKTHYPEHNGFITWTV